MACLVSRTVLLVAPAFSVVAIAHATRASLLAPSWNARTRRCRFGSGQSIWSPVRRLACRPFSSRATRPVALRDRLSDTPRVAAGMVRPDQDRISGKPEEHVEADEACVGGRTRGKDRGVHAMVLVAGAVEVRQRKLTGSRNIRTCARYARRVRLALVPDRSARSLGVRWLDFGSCVMLMTASPQTERVEITTWTSTSRVTRA